MQDNRHNVEPKLKAEFQQIENELNGAYERNDIKTISELLSEQWTILEPSTGLSDKEHFIKAIKDGILIQSKMIKEVQRVQLFGNCAIVVSKGKNKGWYAGTAYNSEQWVTNTYIKEKSKWICVMTQEVPVNGGFI